MKILVVDEDSIIQENRTLWMLISRSPECNVHLVVPSKWGRDNFTPGNAELEITPTPVMFSGKSHRAFYPHLGSLVRKHQPDVLYINAEPESVLAWQSARLKKSFPKMKLVFMSWRNIDYPVGEYPYKLPFLNSIAEKQTLQWADHCVCRNMSAKEILARKGFTKTTMIPPGVDTSQFVPGVVGNTPTLKVGFVGRLVREKGIDLVFEAAARLRFDFHIAIAGDGPGRDSLESLAKSLGINSRVQWRGYIVRNAMPSFLRGLDVLVLPSRTARYWKEQFGRVLIEAMACGVPVIGSDSGEIPNVVGDAGLVFKEGSVEGLVAGLQKLNADRALAARLRDAGLHRVRKEYDIALTAARFQELFKKLST